MIKYKVVEKRKGTAMLTREEIRKMTQEATYKKGLQLYYSKNRITDFNVTEQRGTGRRAAKIRDIAVARVRGTGMEQLKVRLEVDREADNLVTSSCECLAFANFNGLCVHCVAVLLKYADWRVKQDLYTRPEGNFQKIGGPAASAPAEAETLAGEPAAPATPASPAAETSPASASAMTGVSRLPQDEWMLDMARQEAALPKEDTTLTMKALLEKRTRTRTAQVTEPLVYGRIRVEPVLHLGPQGDRVEFRIGADRKYVMKDVSHFVLMMKQGESHSYGKNLTFTHTMDSLEASSRPMAQFILNRAPAYTGTPVRFLTLDGAALEELLLLCENTGIHIIQETVPGQDEKELWWEFAEGWPEHELTLTGEYEPGSRNSGRPAKIRGVRGTTGEFELRVGNGLLFAFEDCLIYRMPRRQADAVEDWLKTLRPKPQAWNSERLRTYLKTHTVPQDETIQHSFYIERADLPSFCRELLPQMKQVFQVMQDDFDEEDFETAKAEYHFYLDTPAKDVVTCRALASYGQREYALYRGGSADRGSGLADRDLVSELSVWQALGTWMPLETAAAGVSERMIASDEESLYQFLTEGIAFLQNLGNVYVSDALRKISVRPSPKISVGVSLSGDMLNLSLDTEGMSREELAELLGRYDRKKKFHRLKNGDFIQMDEEDMEALADLQEGLGFSEKDLLKQEVMEIPRFRSLYLDKQMRSGAMDGILVDRTREFKSLVKDMRTVEDNDFEVPSSLNDTMRGYQKHGFLWMKTLAANGFGGILADDMGLGKTLQVISFLLSEHEEAAEGLKAKKPTLIVCPASLLYNWKSEIEKFAPALNSCLIVGGAPERESMIRQILPDEDTVYITSYDMLRRDIEQYEPIRFGCQVIDEAQYIKNHYTKAAQAVKQVSASFKMALTGTPIENRLSELWSIFDYLMPGFLYSYDQFSKRFEKPIVSHGDEDATARLQRMIGPFVLRRLKKEVLRDLPEKIEENLIIPMEGEQRELYDARVMNLKMELAGKTDEEFRSEQFAVLAELTRMRQICCDPGLLYEGYRGSVAKVDACMELIESVMESGHKMLIFSQFTSLLEVLEGRLSQTGIEYYKLEGATPPARRMEMVEKFNREDNPVQVFLISLKAGGTGLNLTAADVVIHFDPWWNKAVENQATDRVHRIGQKNVVNVYKLIAQNTIEENIVKLQERKRALAESILSGDAVGSGTFSRDDLMEILG